MVRGCELRVPLVAVKPGASSLIGRGTAADCTCSVRVTVLGEGSSGLAFPLGLEDPAIAQDGGVARELPGAAGGGGRGGRGAGELLEG